jgi:hypothetical protein
MAEKRLNQGILDDILKDEDKKEIFGFRANNKQDVSRAFRF